MTSNQELQTNLEQYIEDTIEARFDFAVPGFDAGPVELHRALVEVQEVLTVIERFLSNSVRAKAALDRKQASVKMVWQEAWDRALSNSNKKLSFGDYTTGKEKASEANLSTLNEARSLRQIEEVQSFAHEAVEVIRLHYYGLDKVRQDIRKRLDMSQTDYYS